MVKYIGPPIAELDRGYAALGDPTRRDIVARLAERDGQRVTDLAAPYSDRMSLPAVSKHLRVLESAGLIEQRKSGRTRHCHLRAQRVRDLSDWLNRYRAFWTGTLDALAAYAEAGPDPADRRDAQAPPATPATEPEPPVQRPPLPDYLL
ncbi:MAG: metalloregulator ArsR/SmtB family transcription factor [Planctomycetota bacterium]